MDDVIEEVKVSKKVIINQLQEKVEALNKELTQQKSYVDMYRKESSQRQSEIDEIHDFLDGLPDVMPKEKANYSQNKISTRLLSWIAKKASI